MNLPTLNSAQSLRDGGIDAMAALDDALAIAILDLPDDRAAEIKPQPRRPVMASTWLEPTPGPPACQRSEEPTPPPDRYTSPRALRSPL